MPLRQEARQAASWRGEGEERRKRLAKLFTCLIVIPLVYFQREEKEKKVEETVSVRGRKKKRERQLHALV